MPEPFLLNLILALFLVVAVLSALARRLRASSAVVMLIAGVLLALAPGVPPITLDPDLILLALLPPLLYSSGVGMSWRGFRSNLRPILSLAIGCVLFTATAVAAVAHYGLGLSWAVGYVLGAIVSPPDSVAPQSLRHRFKLPRRLLTILEGESLANDATALVALSAGACSAVETGQFSAPEAVLQVRGNRGRRESRSACTLGLGRAAAAQCGQRPPRGNHSIALADALSRVLAAARGWAARASSPAWPSGCSCRGTGATTSAPPRACRASSSSIS